MQSHQYEVTLYWHTGGSIYLGAYTAKNQAEAERIALDKFLDQLDVQGNFQLETQIL